MKLRKGDNIIVIAGKDKGTKASIKKVLPSGRLVVDGVAKIKRHQKSRRRNESGQIIERESSIHSSNVLLVDAKSGKGTRVGKKLVGEKWVRVAKKSGEQV